MNQNWYVDWRNYVENQPTFTERIQMKFENGTWQQTTNSLDVFDSYDHVRNVCDENLICWMDAYHYSVMKQNPVSNEIYQFIQHRAGVIREGFKENFWRGFDKEMAKESALKVADKSLDFLSFLSDCIF